MPGPIHSVALDTDIVGVTRAQEITSPAEPSAPRVAADRVSGGLIYFAHLARFSLPDSDLDPREIDDLRRDLAVLVAEATRPRLRHRLLDALLDAVLDELLPALPGPARAELVEARPSIPPHNPTAS